VILLLHGFPTASHMFSRSHSRACRPLSRDRTGVTGLWQHLFWLSGAGNDRRFLRAGAEAYWRDLPDAEIQLLDIGYFALETHAAVVRVLMHGFLERQGI
jgi:hypothetical protein